MIDTIVLRIHDLHYHKELADYLNKEHEGYSRETGEITKEDYDSFMNIRDKNLHMEILKLHKKGQFLIRHKSQKLLNNSGHYFLNVFINYERDFLEFNFSIPKYYYGTNVFMYVPHFSDKSFAFHNNQSLQYSLDQAYDRLIRFLKYFMDSELSYIHEIDYTKVEINRIDLCYNQVFNSERDALKYLEYQKEIRRKHSRKDSNSFREYETSLMYITARYSLKVYHKGAEYLKHDLKENCLINKERKEEYFNIDGLQAFASKILRYEITIRSKYLSYLFKQKVFRKNCPYHKANYKIYKSVEMQLKKNESIFLHLSRLKSEKTKENYLKLNPIIKISTENKAIYRNMERLLDRQSEFMLQVSKEVDMFNKTTVKSSHYESRALFSKELFKACTKVFLDFVNEFQVIEKPNRAKVAEIIDEYNQRIGNKLPKNEMLKFYSLLENGSFDKIRKENIYSKSTFFRYVSRFKKIGITQQNIVPEGIKIVSKVDLVNYYSHIMYSKPLIKKSY